MDIVTPPIVFHVYGLPRTKGSGRGLPFEYKHGPKRGRLGVRVINDNPLTAGWERTVSTEAQRVRRPECPWTDTPIALRVIFGLPKPKSWTKKQPPYPYRRPDLDKMLRVIKDALTGVIYKDDSQVCSIVTEKVFSSSPGVDVQVRPLIKETP